MGRHTRFIGYGYDLEKGQRKCDRLLIKLQEQNKKENSLNTKTEANEKNNSIENLIKVYKLEVIGEVKESTIRAYLPELIGGAS